MAIIEFSWWLVDIGRRLIRDFSSTSLQLVVDLSVKPR